MVHEPYVDSAEDYDAIYSKWDYAQDARLLKALIEKHCRSDGTDLLDVACGTGRHLALLKSRYRVEGLDLTPQMLRVARRILPGIRLHRASFLDFDLGRKFDVIICMGSAIGYARTRAGLRKSLWTMAAHLKPGGALFIAPWVLEPDWKEGHMHVDVRGEEVRPITRMAFSGRRGNVAVVDMHHLIGTPRGITHHVERHELGLWTVREHLDAVKAAGLRGIWLPKSKSWFRGLLVGEKPLTASSRPHGTRSAAAGRPSRRGRAR